MPYTNIDDPSAYFQTALYTATDSNLSITNDGNSDLQPDLIWFKRRDDPTVHAWFNSSIGRGTFIYTPGSAAELAVAAGYELLTFDSDGFSLGLNQYGVTNSSGTRVAWQWKANGGTTTSVSASGTGANCVNASTHQVNQDAGFSIITYTGRADQITVHQTTNLTHGLGVTPDFTIMKKRDGTGDWVVMGKYVTTSSAYSANEHLHLNTSDAISGAEYTGYYAPTSTHIRLGDALVNDTGDDYICYAFAEKQGYSKFGKYVGNGNGNGPFVYTGFKPAFVMVKRSDSTGNWFILDTKRSPSNLADNYLSANTNSVELNYLSAFQLDIVSNGFKLRTSYAETNASGGSYIYMAFAENPFVTSTGIPTTAR